MADELLLRLRGKATVLLTMTQDQMGAEAGMERWQAIQSYAVPGQKRILTLSRASRQVTEVDARFQLLIPDDLASFAQLDSVDDCVVERAPQGLFSEAIHEVSRRLNLTHTVALFVPSTMDVDQDVDNRIQVQSALSFLGNLFGGATSSNAEGAWQSEESGLVTEQVTIVRTFVSKKALNTHLDDVFSFASELKMKMKQEAVAVSVDNQLILV